MGEDTSDSNAPRKEGDGSSGWQSSVKATMDRLKKSPFARDVAAAISSEIGRFMGINQQGKMDATRAQQLSTNLHQVLAELIGQCKEEQKKLRPGGLLGFGGREPSTHDVDTALAGVTALTFHFEHQLFDHLKRARAFGSPIALQFMPASSDDPGQPTGPHSAIAGGLGGRGVVGTFALEPDRLRVVSDRLRKLLDYAIKFAEDVQRDIASPHGSNPSAHERALNKAIMLAQRLDGGCMSILQLLDPTIDPQAVPLDISGSYPAIAAPKDDSHGGDGSGG